MFDCGRDCSGGLLGPGERDGTAALNHNRLSLGNRCDDIVQEITFLIFAVSPDTIDQPFMLIDQHGKTGKWIVVRLSCLCEARDDVSILRPLSDPEL